MFSRLLTWPKLIGIATASIGVGFVLSGVAHVLLAQVGEPASREDTYAGVGMVAVSALLVTLGWYLYHAREWARRVLLAIAVCVSLACAVTAGSAFFRT